MNKGYENFISQIDATIVDFPSLERVTVDGHDILKGTLAIIDQEGKYWEDYEIELHASEQFPYRFPDLYETSGKIPPIGDWHVNEDTLSCCITVPPEEIIRCKEGITLSSYIKEQVVPYLFNQTHRRVEGYYVNGEYSHGVKGLLEYYSEILQTKENVNATVKLLAFIATNDKPDRTSTCFCGNRNKYRHCHRKAYEKLKAVGDEPLLIHARLIAERYG